MGCNSNDNCVCPGMYNVSSYFYSRYPGRKVKQCNGQSMFVENEPDLFTFVQNELTQADFLI